MTVTIKSDNLDNDYYMELTIDKYSSAYRVALYNPIGHAIRSQYYPDITSAKKYYSYLKRWCKQKCLV